MKEFSCPSCGAAVPFKSSVSVFAVCAHCDSMIVRRDLDLENLGKAAALPADLSPVQLGTRGSWQGNVFEVIGRLKLKWEDGSWNEWYVSFSDGTQGWLAEAQGFFCLNLPADSSSWVPAENQLRLGERFEWGGKTFEVDDIKRAECVGAEGELPFAAPKGRKTLSVDLTGPEGAFACLEYAAQSTPKLFLGQYVELEDLSPSNLRKLEGW